MSQKVGYLNSLQQWFSKRYTCPYANVYTKKTERKAYITMG